MTYPGGKNGAGVYQTIINLMPPHEVYVEPFLGGGAVMRLKKPALVNIGVDLDSAAIARFRDVGGIACFGDAVLIVKNGAAGSQRQKRRYDIAEASIVVNDGIRGHRQKRRAGPGSHAKTSDTSDRAKFIFWHDDALKVLRGSPHCHDKNTLIYCDPPYVHSTRTRTDLYRFEMSDDQHRQLLNILLNLPCRVMISGYWTKLYSEALRKWNHTTFQAVTRSGRVATEHLWFNFPVPVALHDYRYLGRNFRERERIKRKTLRWTNRLRRMPAIERHAMMHALDLTSPNQ